MSRTGILIAGPSGSGKTTLTQALVQRMPLLTKGITVTLLATWIDGNLRAPILLPAGAVLLSLVAAIACFLPALPARATYPGAG